MSASERRQEIMNILVNRRQETAKNLAAEFGVSEKTIYNDVLVLTRNYPLETVKGRYGGGIKLVDWFRPTRNVLCEEQKRALEKACTLLSGEDLVALQSILTQFSVL